MARCSYCHKEIPRGTGKLFIKKIGKMFWFCSNKCEKNLNLGRKETNWTIKQKKVKKK